MPSGEDKKLFLEPQEALSQADYLRDNMEIFTSHFWG